jgi:hypothetical protein
MSTSVVLSSVVLFAGIACKKKEAEPPAAAELISLSHGLPQYPGANGDATKSYMNGLHFVTDSIVDGPVNCAEGDDCGGAASVHLRMLPEANAHRVDIGASLAAAGNAGFIIAMVANVDSSHTFGPLSLAPGDTAYLWAGPTQHAGKVFGFYKINRTNGQAQGVAKAQYAAYCPAAGPRTIPAVHIPMYQCQTTPLYGNAQNADGAGPGGDNSLYRFARNPIYAATMLHSQGLWISCSLGCCQAGSIVQDAL